jgi:hypothetical protein
MKAVKCMLGMHAWTGCKCRLCGALRDTEHVWRGCRCAVCAVTRNVEHDCRGTCTCSVCGATSHAWDETAGVCSRCGCGAISVRTAADFARVREDLAGFYRLESHIIIGPSGFSPVGALETPFRGIFDGNGHTVRVHLDSWKQGHNQTLFEANDGHLTNLNVECSLRGNETCAAALAAHNSGLISRCRAHGSVEGDFTCAGGLVGLNSDSGTVELCASDCTVETHAGLAWTGGLVGRNTGTIRRSFALGSVKGTGPLAGRLVGQHTGTIEECFATATVENSLGVYGWEGLVGSLLPSKEKQSVVLNSYWLVSNKSYSLLTRKLQLVSKQEGNGTPLESAAMTTRASYQGWDFSGTWTIDDGRSVPQLRCLAELELQHSESGSG